MGYTYMALTAPIGCSYLPDNREYLAPICVTVEDFLTRQALCADMGCSRGDWRHSQSFALFWVGRVAVFTAVIHQLCTV